MTTSNTILGPSSRVSHLLASTLHPPTQPYLHVCSHQHPWPDLLNNRPRRVRQSSQPVDIKTRRKKQEPASQPLQTKPADLFSCFCIVDRTPLPPALLLQHQSANFGSVCFFSLSKQKKKGVHLLVCLPSRGIHRSLLELSRPRKKRATRKTKEKTED